MGQQVYEIDAQTSGVYVIRAASREQAVSIAREIEGFGWEPQLARRSRS